MALSCHTAMDLLCQEMRDACWVSPRSRGSPLSLCCGVVTARSSQHERAVTLKERDVLRRNEGRRNVSDRLKV